MNQAVSPMKQPSTTRATTNNGRGAADSNPELQLK